MRAIDPTDGSLVSEHREATDAEIDRRLETAAGAAARWATSSHAERSAVLRETARLLRDRRGTYAELMAREMGKPVRDGRAEADKCALVCEYYAEHGERLVAPEPVATEARKSFIAFRPLGLVLAVMPWNYPFWQVFRFAAPAIAAGNGGVLKHASNVPGCALAIETVLRDAGLPEGVFTTLLVGGSRVGGLIDDRRIAAVTLTGSTPAGRSVGERAGRALKKAVLELGGSDPYVVLEDADLEHAARVCAKSRLLNAGQSCISAKRFIVVDAVREKWVPLFVEAMRGVRVGKPLDEATEMGPLARVDLRDELAELVDESVSLGARAVLGGKTPDGPGAFYPPTVLVDVAPGQPAHDDELFGPVASVIAARDEADAIRIANGTCFGLGAAVFTADVERGRRIAEESLEAGCCFVNDFVKSDPRLPFGGIKESGYGRELAAFGIREFMNVKTVWVS